MNMMMKKSKIPVKKIIKNELIEPLQEYGYDFRDNEKVSFDNFLYKSGYKGMISQFSISYYDALSHASDYSHFSISSSSNILSSATVYFDGKICILEEIRTEDDLILCCRKYRDVLINETMPLIDKYQRELFQPSPEMELYLYENYDEYLNKYNTRFPQKATSLDELSEQFKILFEGVKELSDDEKSEILCMAGAAYSSYLADKTGGEIEFVNHTFGVDDIADGGKYFYVIEVIFSIYYLDDYEPLYTNFASWTIIEGKVYVEKLDFTWPRKFE